MSNKPSNPKTEFPNGIPKELKEFYAIRVGELFIKNRSRNEIAKLLGISVRQVDNLLKSNHFKDFLADAMDKAKIQASSFLKTQMASLAPKAVAALEKALEKGSVEGVKVVMKSLGALEDDDQNQTAPITVVFPKGNDIKTVESSSKKPE